MEDSVNHKLIMLSEGDSIDLPYSDYSKVRASEFRIRTDCGVMIKHTLIGDKGDPNRIIRIKKLTAKEQEQLLLDKSKAGGVVTFHKRMIKHHLKELVAAQKGDCDFSWLKEEVDKYVQS